MGKPEKTINLALQGGGSHGAFAWGVLDRLLEDDRLDIEGVVGTSAGAMNAAVLAYGLSIGGKHGARAKLREFWTRIGGLAAYVLMEKVLPMGHWLGYAVGVALVAWGAWLLMPV